MDQAFSHQPHGSRAAVCDDTFLGFVRQPHGVVILAVQQGPKAAAKSKTKFSTCSFHLRFLCNFWRMRDSCKTRKAALRLLQGMQCVRKTDVIVRHPRICLTKAARLLQDKRALYFKAVARAAKNCTMAARLQCGNCLTYRFVL